VGHYATMNKKVGHDAVKYGQHMEELLLRLQEIL
jgi:hypothetical protein